MLVIRPEQEQALQRAMRFALAREVAESHRASLPDDEVERRVAVAVDKAERYGITRRRDLRTFVSLCIAVGPHFDRHPPLAEILGRHDLPVGGRLTKLLNHRSAADWAAAAAIR